MSESWMSNTGLAILLALFAAALVPGAPSALAQSEQERARDRMEEGDILGYASIRSLALKAVPGRVVGQRLDRLHSGRTVYRLRVLQATGRVVEVVIDAKSGRILSMNGRGR